MAFKMRPYNEGEIELINSLIREGESIYGKSESQGHHVQDYVNDEMIKRGLRIKVHPRTVKEGDGITIN